MAMEQTTIYSQGIQYSVGCLLPGCVYCILFNQLKGLNCCQFPCRQIRSLKSGNVCLLLHLWDGNFSRKLKLKILTARLLALDKLCINLVNKCIVGIIGKVLKPSVYTSLSITRQLLLPQTTLL